MNFLIAAQTDAGLRKKNNQDSLCVMKLNTVQGGMVFAILCDGMGGFEKGEVASACVVRAFRRWVLEELPELSRGKLDEILIRDQWMNIVLDLNRRIKEYGDQQGVRMGTTAVVMLLTQDKYYILNVGDSRAYEIGNELRQLTCDQSLVAREVAAGRLTPEAAEKDSRRNVLLQCIGGANRVAPDLYMGNVVENAVYLLCSDGFRHEVFREELYEALRPEVLPDEETMNHTITELIELNKQRQERDNISALLIRTC